MFSLEYRCQLEKRCKKQPPGSLIEADASKRLSATQRKRPLEPTDRLRTAAAERAAHCHWLATLDQRESLDNQRQCARESNAITNFTRQPRSRHSAGGNAEDAARGAKRNPKGAGVPGAGAPPRVALLGNQDEWLCSVTRYLRYVSAQTLNRAPNKTALSAGFKVGADK